MLSSSPTTSPYLFYQKVCSSDLYPPGTYNTYHQRRDNESAMKVMYLVLEDRYVLRPIELLPR